MKSLLYKCKSILKNNKGETLVESAISIVLLTMLFLTITTMIMTSINITTSSNAKAANDQQAANLAALAITGQDAQITFTSGVTEVNVDIKISKSTDGNFVAFTPKE